MKKVLIVDDQSSILLSLSYLLKRVAAVITSETMDEARRELSGNKFDLVISDLRLTGSDSREGLELLCHIRSTSPETKVVIMSGLGSDDLREEAYALGALHYYEKPVDIAHLLSQVQALG